MTKMLMAYIGFLLLAMHFSSQVQAQIATTKSPAVNATTKAVGGSYNMTKMPDVTKNNNIPKGASASLQSSSVALIIPMVVVGSLLQGRF